MSDCFLSYRRTPSAAVATALQAKLLSQFDINAYVDTTRTDSTTVPFPDRLMQAIEDAPVFVCLLGDRDGQHSLESEWVLKEIQRAYDLQKFCIPVFQESYRPLPDMPPAVEYLLSFDGVHILDEKNIMVDASVSSLADLIRPHRRKSRRLAWMLAITGILVVVGIIGVVGGKAIFGSNPPAPQISRITPDVSNTPIDEPTPVPSISPTFTPEDSAFVQHTSNDQWTPYQRDCKSSKQIGHKRPKIRETSPMFLP